MRQHPSISLRRPPLRQRGAFAIMTPVLVLAILALIGFALSLAMMYNRKIEVQTAAEGIALAAAKQLNGTDAGVRLALQAASAAASTTFYGYQAFGIGWTDDAVSFSAAPYGSEWVEAAAAQNAAAASSLFYAKVDTSKFAGMGLVDTLFLHMQPSTPASANVSSTVIAGRATINVMPLALCAMSTTAAADRGGELVEYGFRRGISYDLMKLNPVSNASGANYLVNPVSLPGTGGAAISARLDIVRPFVCTGTMAVPSLAGGSVKVEPGFPLASVVDQLNSRFGVTAPPCTSAAAPPDTNIKEFSYASEFSWMTRTPKGQAADSTTSGSKLLTIADLAPADIPAATTADQYGPLWTFAKAARFSAYQQGAAEPVNGYTTFSSANWSTLYAPGAPSVKSGSSYPSTLYTNSVTAPTDSAGVANRRVLTIPLLRCPVAAGASATAEILALGKFFMTVKATDVALYAEFAGVLPRTAIGGQMELYP
jgi:Flp pilus assembly protein TadG